MPEETGDVRASARCLRALILEDDHGDAELVAATLRRAGYSLRFDVVDSAALFHRRLRAADYDIVLADYNLGAWTAVDALKILEECGKDIPLIVVTGALGDEEAVECIKRGAADYVLKERLERVPLAVDRALRRKAYRDEIARQEKEIRRAKEEWELTFDTVPDPVLLLDEHFRIKHANRATAELLGQEASQLLGQPCYEAVHGLAAPHPDCPYQRAWASGKEERSDIVEPRLGTTFEAAVSPFFDSSGAVQGCVHVLHDIKERKKAEESFRQLSTLLLRTQDDERRRIARELHDSTAQNIAALGLNLAWIEQSSPGVDARTREVLAESQELVKRCSQEIRDFSYLLYPPMLDEHGLAMALQWHVDGFARRTGIRTTLDLPDELPRLPLNAETALFRVVQECLTNVHRHSGSPTVSIRVVRESNCLSLEVADQGHGLPSASPDGNNGQHGVGLRGMKERMRELGGRLEIDSNRHGTTIRASLPLEGASR